MEYRPTSIDDVRSFLEGARRAVLSTLGRDGGPHLVVVDYLVDRNGLLLNGRVNRRWVSNLRNDPRASALIHDHADVSHWVRVRGDVELVREGDEAAVEDAKVMARRYGDDPEQFTGQHRVTWRLVAHQVLEPAE
jgi:PPOX class probable F420-dependent enzyme